MRQLEKRIPDAARRSLATPKSHPRRKRPSSGTDVSRGRWLTKFWLSGSGAWPGFRVEGSGFGWRLRPSAGPRPKAWGFQGLDNAVFCLKRQFFGRAGSARRCSPTTARALLKGSETGVGAAVGVCEALLRATDMQLLFCIAMWNHPHGTPHPALPPLFPFNRAVMGARVFSWFMCTTGEMLMTHFVA